ncbi:hypothetical protein GCM10010424_51350 [Streptomyces lienomycini]
MVGSSASSRGGVPHEGEGGGGALGEAAGEFVRVVVEVVRGERGALGGGLRGPAQGGAAAADRGEPRDRLLQL